MKRRFAIPVVITVILIAVVVAIEIRRHVATSTGQAAKAFVKVATDALEAATDTIAGVEYALRYDGAEEVFVVRPQEPSLEPARVSEAGLSSFLQHQGVKPPAKLAIIYEVDDFPTPVSSAAFESRLRTLIAPTGAKIIFLQSSRASN